MLVVAFAGVALAAVITCPSTGGPCQGTSGPDQITGSAQPDQIFALGGNDQVHAAGGGDGPHGDPIPAADGTLEPDDSFALASAAVGQRVRINRVEEGDVVRLAYLRKHGLIPGKMLEVKEVREVDGVITVEDEAGETLVLGGPLADAVFVRSTPEAG